jgi:Uma2 family endonuclease
MATAGKKRMTAEEFFEWANRPENQDRHLELERGEVVEMPPPGELHGVVCSLIVYLLSRYVFQRGKGYICCNDTGLLIERDPDTLRGPDIMLFNETRRMEELSPKLTEGVPCLVVEVLSPHDRTSKINLRVSQYLKLGVALVWLVDPEVRVVTVYQADKTHQVLDETDDLLGGDVLPEFRCKVADLFAMPGQTTTN